MSNNIPISFGAGTASVASENVAGVFFQQVELYGAGGGSVASIDPEGSLKVSVVGTIKTVAPAGSIIAVSGTVTFPAGSVTAVTFAAAANQSVSGAITAPPGSVIGTYFGLTPSIVGTYAEDAPHTSGDKGVFSLSVRNDTQTSITSNDGDYSPFAVGPTGALIATDAPITKWIQGTADLRVVLGTSVAVMAAQGASVFTYIREIQVANMGSASVLVTFAGGLGSILGYTIAPAGGGSNFITRMKTGENSAFTASISGTASVLVSAQGFTAKI